ncbi:MAG: hypothetical protein IJE49_02705 [Agathobacter sp.]|nr:hypothetical protein [Agathobacter sp.]
MNYVKQFYNLMTREDFKCAGITERITMVKREIYEPNFYKGTSDGWDHTWNHTKKLVEELVQCEVRTSRVLHTYTLSSKSKWSTVHYANIGEVEHNSEFIKLLNVILPLWGEKISMEAAYLSHEVKEGTPIEESIIRFGHVKTEYASQLGESENKSTLFIQINSYDQVYNGKDSYAPSDYSGENKTVTEVLEIIAY